MVIRYFGDIVLIYYIKFVFIAEGIIHVGYGVDFILYGK